MWSDADVNKNYTSYSVTLYLSNEPSCSTVDTILADINVMLEASCIDAYVTSEAPYKESDTTEIVRLSKRQFEVLQCIAQGMSNNEIGRALDISPETTKVHVKKLLTRLNVKNRTAAAHYYTNINNLKGE